MYYVYLSPGQVQHLWHLLETVRKWKIVLVPDAPFGLDWFAIPILVIWILFYSSNHFGNIALLQIAIIFETDLCFAPSADIDGFALSLQDQLARNVTLHSRRHCLEGSILV